MSQTIRVGPTDYTLRPFKAYKAILAGELISHVGDEIREIMAAERGYERQYGQEHAVRFTRAQATNRGWDLPDSAYVTPENGEPYVDMPAMPSMEERMMFAFPRAFKLARSEVTKLLALVVVGDQELMVAEGSGNLDKALTDLGNKMLHEGEIGEIVDLIAASISHVQDQLAPRGESLGKIRAFFNRATNRGSVEEGDTRNTKIEPMRVVSSSPESSTSAPEPTDGAETESSTALSGASFSA